VTAPGPTPPQAAGAAEPRTVALAVLTFAALSLACAVLSDGFLTADALTHYLYAKYAFREPCLLVDVWGRPLVTALYALPATLGGRLAVRVTSLLLALACSLASYGIARGQGLRRPALAVICTLAQPLLFLNSFAEMTELPFATLAGLAFWAYQSRRWWAAAALAALLPLARPEGFEFLALAALGLVVNRRYPPLLLLPLPLLLWNHAGWALYGHAGPWHRWLIDHWPYSRESTYPAGHLLQFVFFLPAVVGPILLPANLLGAWRSVRRAPDEDRHVRGCRAATAAIPLSILAVHSLLYALGKMASYGEPRYLLVAAPFWAVLSARGWEWIAGAMAWKRPLRRAAIGAAVPLLALLAHPVLPLRPPAHWRQARTFADRYRTGLRRAGYPRVMAAHPAVFYYLDLSPADRAAVVESCRETIASPPPGTVLLWDPIYSARNALADRAVSLDEVTRAGWQPLPELDEVLRGSPPVETRPTPDPADRLSVKGEWHAFKSPRPLTP
jgi:hypothetical protein